MRVGVGYDAHRLVEGRKLFLGGIEIPFHKGLLGHSDGDVLIHAICDAILGAISEGDIGTHFPDTDSSTKGIESVKILRHVIGLASKKGFAVVNVDAVVAAQEPKIAPVRDAMRKSMAAILGTGEDRISIKGKTTEDLGFVGRGEGIEVYAVVLLEKSGEK
ncbi:MAG TPA: 2-C-methyl-D-erythritol 2,4-cyclodiphosphate synthase [Syntrophorhabdus sp.]|nr:2-C-methyl-D-erythritol 2,4-cyclodiphosphate synthase [Syntrophorhabdus sp.]HQP56971.1 2-C-methyl-D-erythritol 2,4-cyclodiphosphate synthase [Syntrophorhabdus sp.]